MKMKKYEKKYKLTNITKEWGECTFYRIKALRNFCDVKAGDLGGWVEGERNLSQYGNCWIYNDAVVCDNALVSDNAVVGGNAVICDNSVICSNARISENVIISDNAVICGNSDIFGSAQISDDVEIYDYVNVYGDAVIFGKVKLFNDVKIYGNATIFGEAEIESDDDIFWVSKIGSKDDTTTFFRSRNNQIYVTCGGFYGTLDEFVKEVKETHGDNDYAKIYLLAVEMAKIRINTALHKDQDICEF